MVDTAVSGKLTKKLKETMQLYCYMCHVPLVQIGGIKEDAAHVHCYKGALGQLSASDIAGRGTKSLRKDKDKRRK